MIWHLLNLAYPGLSPYSFLLILTFPHLLGQVYLWQIRLCSLQVDPISLEHQHIGLYLLLCIHHKIMFTPIHSFGADKVSRAYVNPYIPTHKPLRRIKVYVITRLILNLLFGVALMSDLVICKFRKSMVLQDTECPYWDQVSLNNTNHTQSHFWNLGLHTLGVIYFATNSCSEVDVNFRLI